MNCHLHYVHSIKQKYVTKIEHDVRCGKAQRDGHPAAGWVQTMVLFVTVCGPKFTKLSSHIRARYSLQFCFPIDDSLLNSGDICDQVMVVQNGAEKI